MVYEDPEAILNDEKAVRNDDLGADIAQWDSYLVQEYQEDLEWKDLVTGSGGAIQKPKNMGVTPVLVCTGGLVTEEHETLFESLRSMLLRRNKRRHTASFFRYLRNTYGKNWMLLRDESRGATSPLVHLSAKKRRTRQREGRELLKDLDSAQDAIRRYADSTWWDWSEGSTLHF